MNKVQIEYDSNRTPLKWLSILPQMVVFYYLKFLLAARMELNLAGFFGFFDYSKPGPGVSKDEPQKHGFFIFFDIFFRKFWSLVSMNILYFISFIPIIIIIGALLLYFQNDTAFYLCIFIFIATIGPATSGFTYIMRNFAREEHAFLWLDYKDTIVMNWKQSLAASFINAVVFILLLLSVYFYYVNSTSNPWYIIPLGIGVSCSIIFMFMQYYLYVMLITFKLNLKQLYMNAFLFAFIGLLRNILITVIILVSALIFYIIPISLILIPLISLSFLGLLINKNVWSLIKKYIVDPYNKENGNVEKKEVMQSVFEDMGNEKRKKNKF